MRKTKIRRLCFFRAIVLLSFTVPVLQQLKRIATHGIYEPNATPTLSSQAAFLQSVPKSVVIVTYQRCGSTFFSNIFIGNPNVFYFFEPLDSLYSSLYGTSQGWNIPSDITSLPNGTQRIIPGWESSAVSEYLQNLLFGDMDLLPTEALLHKFWKSSLDFSKCRRKNNLTIVNCYDKTRSYCGTRFGDRPPERLEECNRLLSDKAYLSAHPNPDVKKKFTEYLSCMKSYRSIIDTLCISLLKAARMKSRLRVAKLVRAKMDSITQLLDSEPNLRVIHLVRDPRAVALSRKEYDQSARGYYSNHAREFVAYAESKLYCAHAIDNVKSQQRLERLYPGRFYSLTYEDLVSNPVQITEDIYYFLNETPPTAILARIQQRSERGRLNMSGKSLAQRWRKRLSYVESINIIKECWELFSFLNVNPLSDVLLS